MESEVVVNLDKKHRTIKKRYVTSLSVNGIELPLNNYLQETLANVIIAFTETLKHIDKAPNSIQITVEALDAVHEVDAHRY